MAKILVVGSQKAHDPGEFRSACRAIGAALAQAGHEIVAAGCGDEDAETWVMDGANSAQTPNRKTSVIPFAPAVPGTQDLLTQTPGISGRWPNLIFLPPFTTKGSWDVGQPVALIRSDAALLIGGGLLTANVGSLALELDKPYHAVAALGGAAKIMAAEDYAKHRAMGMPQDCIAPGAASPDFGRNTVKAIEFTMRQRKDRKALRNSIVLLIASLTILAGFLGYLFRHDPLGREPQLVYTTAMGAIVGVMLSFLVGRSVRREESKVPSVIGQLALACFLGVLYGFFALHAGSFYNIKIKDLSREDVDSLAINMGLLGIGVGALLGPASKRALEELGRTANLDAG
jgi:hypothetical protein